MEHIDVLINSVRIENRLEEMANEIMKDYKGKELVFIGILKGATMFMIELAKKIKNSVEFEFIQVKSYTGTESTGKIQIIQDLKGNIEGKDVIIIEDIIDTGKTLEYLTKHLKKYNPNSVKIACLLSKSSKRVVELNVDYIGFSIPDEFVIGYGMDYNGKYRNLPYIGVLRQ